MFENQTEQTIRQRMLDSITADLDKQEGSFVYDTISPAALELAIAYTELDRVLRLGFAQTTYGQYLDYRAEEHGLTRKPAARASGQVTVSGAEGALIPLGSLFATAAGVRFKTAEEVSIGDNGQAGVAIEAVEPGNSGNVPAAAINQIPVAIPGITGVTNAAPSSGGTAAESDKSLLDRLLQKVRLPATSGNIAHYRQWAREVPGIGDARVFPLWNGPGTVKVIVIDSNKHPTGPELVQEVLDHIEGLRPIGADVSVASAAGLKINVSANMMLDTGASLADVKSAFTSALESYLQEIAFQQNYVSYAHIASLLLDTAGVLDHTGLTLNSSTSNIPVADESVAVPGTVSLNEQD